MRLLIVSPHFPPVNAPDHQRVRMALPWFAELGVKAEVLCCTPDSIEAPNLDPLSLDSIPQSVPVHRVASIPFVYTRIFGIGSLSFRSWKAVAAKGDELLSQNRYDAVLFSTTQFPLIRLGVRWKRKFAVPFFVDIQDMWYSTFYDQPGAPPPPGGWKYRFSKALAKRQEAQTLPQAAGLISVSPAYPEMLRERYPEITVPMVTIPFGASELDQDLASRLNPPFERLANAISIVYTGRTGGDMDHLLLVLFQSLALLRIDRPDLIAKIKLYFYGTSYAPAPHAKPTVEPIAEAAGIAGIVTEVPTRLPYFESLAAQQHSDAILLLGSRDQAYSPSKIYPAILTRRPILAVFPRESALIPFLKQVPWVMLITVEEKNSVEKIASDVLPILESWACGRIADVGELPEVLRHEITAESCTRKLIDFMRSSLGAQPA